MTGSTTSNPPRKQAVILVGFMGAGKSSVGRAAAERLGWAFEDLDLRIERREQATVADLFRGRGEAEFRRAEHAALRELLDEVGLGAKAVIALGGGAFAHPANASLLESTEVVTVFLDADPEELWTRCNRQAESQETLRPLLSDRESFRKLYEMRQPHYSKAAFRLETGGKSIEEVAGELVRALGEHLQITGDLDPEGTSRRMKCSC